ncbi:MAG: hypothetical protein ACOCSI_00795, partial [Desulfohalobiaceae bacterium]
CQDFVWKTGSPATACSKKGERPPAAPLRKQCGQADRPSACGKIKIISIDSDYDNDHDYDLPCLPLAVVVVVAIVIDILTNTSRIEVFQAALCPFRTR